jgi:replicative DNA helicase
MMPPAHLTPVDAERCLLGGMILDPCPAIDEAGRVQEGPADFSQYAHQELYRLVVAMRAESKPIAADTVFLEATARGLAAEFGPRPADWFAELIQATPTGANAGYHAVVVRDASLRRRLRHVAARIQSLADGPATELLTQCEAEVHALAESALGRSSDVADLATLVRQEFEDLDGRIANPGRAAGVPSGFEALDNVIGRFKPEELTVIGARPSLGKSALVAAFLRHAARSGVACYLSSLEMSRKEIVQRLLSAESGVALSRIQQARLQPGDVDKLHAAGARLGRLRIFVDDAPCVTTARLGSQLRRFVRRHKVAIAAIDYLQLLEAREPGDSRAQEVAQMSREMKLLAHELKIPILLLSQLNRLSESRPDGRPRMSDLRESGGVEQDADVVMLLHRRKDQPQGGPTVEVGVLVEKRRNGPTGDVPLLFRKALARFEDVTPDAA